MTTETTKVSNSYLSSNSDIPVATRTIGGGKFQLFGNGLVPEAHDEVNLTYSGDNISVVEYSLGGVVIATLNLTYAGDNLTSIVRV
jgi:hypothetical protein